MLESIGKNNILEYEKLSQEDMEKRGILGRLIGVCADFAAPTRNGRKYSEQLWEHVFNDPIMKERISNGVCYGELGHPADRDETDIEKVAVCLAEQPKKGKDGKLRAVFDILNTPNGKILKTLCDYGSTLGVSSRGTGDVVEGFDGNEEVEPDTYDCQGFDIVLIPAVKEARLQYVTESLNNKKSLKESLQDVVNEANDEEKKVMEDTLTNLDIDLGAEDSNQQDAELQEAISEDEDLTSNQESEEPLDDDTNTGAVDNNEAMVEELQNSIKQVNTLRSDIVTLQEKLSVCYAKESSQEDEIVKLRLTIQKLSEDVKRKEALKNQIRRLNEKLTESNNNNLELKKQVESYAQKLSDSKRDYRSLNESIALREHEVSALKSNITSLNKEIASTSKEKSDEISKLTESLELLKKDSKQQADLYAKKLSNANKLVEKYKATANKAVDKYIESEALKLGVKKEEIKNKLPQSYTFDDIDSICEDLRDYKLSINRLPISITESTKMKPKQSTHEPILPVNSVVDDEVDSALMEMAGL